MLGVQDTMEETARVLLSGSSWSNRGPGIQQVIRERQMSQKEKHETEFQIKQQIPFLCGINLS